MSKAVTSISHAEPWPRDPLRYHTLLPEAPRACSWGRATPSWVTTSPHATAVPPSPLCPTPRVAWCGACSEQPWAETLRSPRRGDFDKPIASGGRAAKCSGRCRTRQQRSHSAECVIQQTATCRGTPAQSDRPTAQPDAEECLKLQHEQTFGKQLGFGGSFGYCLWLCESSLTPRWKTQVLNQGWVFDHLFFQAFCVAFLRAALLLAITRERAVTPAPPMLIGHKQKSHVENGTRMALGEVTQCPN